MKTLIKKLIKKTRHAELDSASYDEPSPVLRTPSPKGRGDKISCAKHTQESTKSVPIPTGRATCVAPLSRPSDTLSLGEGKKCAFTLAEVFSPCRKVKLSFGFTLAEVLITLGIIGIVAALTIPNIISKYNEIVYMAHLKKMVAILETTLSNIHNETGSIPDTFRECHNLMGGDNKEAYSCFEDMIIKYAPLNPNTRRVNKPAPGGGKPLTEYGHAFFYHRLYLPDGSVIAMHLITNGYVIFGFDVNGDKGPNKAGVDLYNVHYYPYQKTGKAYKTISSLNWIDINGCKNGDTQACFATLNRYNFNIPKNYPHKF